MLQIYIYICPIICFKISLPSSKNPTNHRSLGSTPPQPSNSHHQHDEILSSEYKPLRATVPELGFACSMLGKSVKLMFPQNGDVMVMNPMVQSVKNHLKQIPVNQNWLVVSTHLKTITQNGNLPQVGMKIKKYLSCHHLATHTVPLDPKTMKNEGFKA